MSKEQREYENAVCVCEHKRNEHGGITGTCYIQDCRCFQFKEFGADCVTILV